jgi:two-component system sensor histidine kinase CreC
VLEGLRLAQPGRADLGLAKNQVSHRIYVTDAKGIVLLDSSGEALGKDYSRWNDVYLTLRGQYGARSTRSDPNDESTSVMHVARRSSTTARSSAWSPWPSPTARCSPTSTAPSGAC